MPKGKYYEYQIKRAALDDDYLAGNIDELQYARESLDLDLKYEKYIQRKKWKESHGSSAQAVRCTAIRRLSVLKEIQNL